MFCNVGFANDISKIEDIEINGISIGDNLLDHYSKHKIIQNKVLLDARTQTNQLFYTSKIKGNVFQYESNERVGMTEKPFYRIIGMITFLDYCKTGRGNKDETNELIKKCNEENEIKELYGLLNKYFQKYDAEPIKQNLNMTVDDFKIIYLFYHDESYRETAAVKYHLSRFSDNYRFWGVSLSLCSKDCILSKLK